MSATLDAAPIAAFLGCQVVRSEGKRFDVATRPELAQHEATLDVVYARLCEKEWFAKIVEFCALEVLKPNAEKKHSVDNRSLVISGDTGTGKTSFVEILLRQVFGVCNIELDNAFQNLLLARHGADSVLARQREGERAVPAHAAAEWRRDRADQEPREPAEPEVRVGRRAEESLAGRHRARHEERVPAALPAARAARARGQRPRVAGVLYDVVKGVEIAPEFRCMHFWSHVLRERKERLAKGQRNLTKHPFAKRDLDDFLNEGSNRRVYEAAMKRFEKRTQPHN